jgi:hypothetical protein
MRARGVVVAVLLVLLPATGWAAVSYDTATGATFTSVGITVAAGHTNTLLVLCSGQDNQAINIISITGGNGGAWTQLGAANGNGVYRGEIWYSVGPTAGAKTLTVTWSAGPSKGGLVAFAFYDVDGTTPLSNFVATLSGNAVVTNATGNLAINAQFGYNSVSNPTLTGCTTTRDVNAFQTQGEVGAHCTAAPTATFTWSAFDANSIAVGASVHASGGAAAVTPRGLLLGVFP